MTKTLLSLVVLFIVQISSAQVGIGTSNPNTSSALDISSTNSGLLIPRVELTSTTVAAPITLPAVSLLVYNTKTINDVTAGFYYWDGSWKTLKGTTTTSSASGWNLNGNTLSSGSEYLGTNSYHPLVFKVNNVQFARFHPNGGMAFGNGAVASDSNSVAIGTAATTTTNNQAVAIGPSATASYQSVSIGLNASTSANTTIAIGSSAKVNQQNGISIGTTTESNQDATAVGFNSKATGYQSSAFGNGTSATGQNSTAIGNGATTSQANAVILGNSSANVGIGTSTPNTSTKIDVNGQYKLGEKGSLQKNQINFETYPNPSINNLGVGQTVTFDIPIPAGFQPNSTKATIVVTPASDFSGNTSFAISNPRLTSTSTIQINLTNISSANASLYSAHFYIMINEF